MKSEFCCQFFENYSNVKFHENPSSGRCIVPCGRTDMSKLIVALRNFWNAPEMFTSYLVEHMEITAL